MQQTKYKKDSSAVIMAGETIGFLEGDKDKEYEYMKIHEYRFSRIINSIPCSKDSIRIIDIGPTPNTMRIKRLHPHYEISSLDKTNLLRKRLNAIGIQLKTCDLDSQPIPLNDNFFDVVVFTEVLEHIFALPTDILTKIKRMMRKGGKLIISVPNIATFRNRIKFLFGITPLPDPDVQMKKEWIHGHGHIHEYTKKEITSILKSCGFYILSVQFLQPSVRDAFKEAMTGRILSLFKVIYRSITYLFPPLRATIYIEYIKN